MTNKELLNKLENELEFELEKAVTTAELWATITPSIYHFYYDKEADTCLHSTDLLTGDNFVHLLTVDRRDVDIISPFADLTDDERIDMDNQMNKRIKEDLDTIKDKLKGE